MGEFYFNVKTADGGTAWMMDYITHIHKEMLCSIHTLHGGNELLAICVCCQDSIKTLKLGIATVIL